MSFLSPWFLLAGLAAAVPLILHLVHRYESRRIVFPALRYLLRTEREHARQIRLRQLLLLLARIAVIVLVVGAGARTFIRGRGGAHHPTAVAVVLDNSLSSGRVVGERRVLDLLKERALETVELAGPDDRFWVIRAGEPWDVAPPMRRDGAMARVRDTETTDTRGDLSAALERAHGLLSADDLETKEIHLLSDLQRSAFSASAPSASGRDVPVVTYAVPSATSENRFVRAVTIGGGLPPLAGQRSEVAVTIASERLPPAGPSTPDTGTAETGPQGVPGAFEPPDPGVRADERGDEVPIRVVADGRIRAAGSGRPGDAVLLPFGPFPRGPVSGYAETDPDDLRADDRRYFAFSVRPPIAVRRVGTEAFFLDQGLDVLREAGRIVLGATGGAAEVVVWGGGPGASDRGPEAGTGVVIPPTDVALLPALNRALSEAGVPWTYDVPAGAGESVVARDRIPPDLDSVRVARSYGLRPGDSRSREAEVVAWLGSGDPFIVVSSGVADRFVLIAAPLDPAWTELPLTASMVSFLEWAVSRNVRGESTRSVVAGEEIPAPPGVTAALLPDGDEVTIGPSRGLRRTSEAGIYQLVAGDSVVGRVAVNPPSEESNLAPADRDELTSLVGPELVVVESPAGWRRAIFRRRQGPEIWWPLLAAALGLLLLESWIAAAGARAGRATRSDRPSGSEARSPTPYPRRGHTSAEAQ